MNPRVLGALLWSAVVLASPAAAAGQPLWPDTFTARLEALALLETLNAELLSHASATLTLDRWCAEHRLAAPARVIAERVHGVAKVPTADQRRLLAVGPVETVRYRRVKLACGDHVLSQADNWYVPSRLTPEMNQALDTTDIAFGRAVQALDFRRRTLSARLLWSPLPQGWEMGAKLPKDHGTMLEIPHDVLQHRAVLTLPDGTPFSAVVETYTSDVLAFPPPPADARPQGHE